MTSLVLEMFGSRLLDEVMNTSSLWATLFPYVMSPTRVVSFEILKMELVGWECAQS